MESPQVECQHFLSQNTFNISTSHFCPYSLSSTWMLFSLSAPLSLSLWMPTYFLKPSSHLIFFITVTQSHLPIIWNLSCLTGCVAYLAFSTYDKYDKLKTIFLYVSLSKYVFTYIFIHVLIVKTVLEYIFHIRYCTRW